VVWFERLNEFLAYGGTIANTTSTVTATQPLEMGVRSRCQKMTGALLKR
jgi:hypothetical protein